MQIRESFRAWRMRMRVRRVSRALVRLTAACRDSTRQASEALAELKRREEDADAKSN